jgi:hypothetical protein
MRPESQIQAKLASRLITILVFAVLSATTLVGKPWRGIVPFHSTRDQVKALLGEPPPPPKDGSRSYTLNEGRYIYFLDDAEVYIVFAGDDFPANDCRVQPGTVLMIQVTPKKETRLEETHIDLKKFRKFDPSTPPGLGFEGYINESEGLMVRAVKGRVDEIVYTGTAEDKSLCPSYFENAESSISVLVCGLAFDSYGNIKFEDEKARLDNFAIQLQNEPDFKGYIIVYAGRRSYFGEARSRADKAANYLFETRDVPRDKLETIDGGFREEFTVELRIQPKDSPAPAAFPTVNAQEVELITEGTPRKRPGRSKP